MNAEEGVSTGFRDGLIRFTEADVCRERLIKAAPEVAALAKRNEMDQASLEQTLCAAHTQSAGSKHYGHRWVADQLDKLMTPIADIEKQIRIIEKTKYAEDDPNYRRLHNALYRERYPNPREEDPAGTGVKAVEHDLNFWITMTYAVARVLPVAHEEQLPGRLPHPRTEAFRVLADHWKELGKPVKSFRGIPKDGTMGAFIVDAMKIIAPDDADNLEASVRSWISEDYLGGREKRSRLRKQRMESRGRALKADSARHTATK